MGMIDTRFDRNHVVCFLNSDLVILPNVLSLMGMTARAVMPCAADGQVHTLLRKLNHCITFVCNLEMSYDFMQIRKHFLFYFF